MEQRLNIPDLVIAEPIPEQRTHGRREEEGKEGSLNQPRGVEGLTRSVNKGTARHSEHTGL